ncbi:Glutathione hydrolase-like YwrD proenzyme [Ralstonia syzygii]
MLEPAAEIAERGHTIALIVTHKWAAAIPELHGQPGYAQAFMPHGHAPEVGEKCVLRDATATLRRIGETRGRDFYEGELAGHIAAHAVGALTAQDLRDYRPEWVTPIRRRYRGHDVHEIPPDGQGIAALVALGILERFDLGALPVDSADSLHL